MIMKGRVPLRLPLAGVFTIALVAAATLPAWATGQQTAPPPPPPATTAPSVQAVTAVPAPSVPTATVPAPPSPRAMPVPSQAQQPPQPPPSAQPSTPQAPPSRAQRATAPAKTAPPLVAVPAQNKTISFYTANKANKVKLPAEGQQLVDTFDADVAAIYKEVDPKVEARRQAAIKSLEALQDQLTKAGKLDEAVAIRDYLRAGGPPANSPYRFTFFNKGK